MKIINKTLIISLILSFFAISITSAADKTDCGRYGVMSYSDGGGSFEIVRSSRGTSANNFTNFLSINEQLAIIEPDDLNTALLNLKKYCCENKLGDLSAETCKKDLPYFNDNALDSRYLFDHLFDVIMRRLNGLSNDIDIYTKTNMSTDDKGTSRRNRIDEQAKSIHGSTPQAIINKYQEVWRQSPASLGYNITSRIYATFGELNNQDFLIYVSGKGKTNESETVANALKNYKEWTLYDRYINACALSEYFYALLDVGVNSDDKNKTIKKLSDNSCDKFIENQINGENSYIVLIIKKSANLFLSNYVEGYVGYLYQRQEKLEKLISDISDRWLDVVRGVPNLENRTTK